MPWNDNSNPGPWGSPGGGPKGSGPKGGGDGSDKGSDKGADKPSGEGRKGSPWGSLGGGQGGEPPKRPRPGPGGPGRPAMKAPDFEELMRQIGDRFRGRFGMGPGGRPTPGVLAAIAGAAFGACLLYTSDAADE